MQFRSILVAAVLAVAAASVHGQQPPAQQQPGQQPQQQPPPAQTPPGNNTGGSSEEPGAPIPMPKNMELVPINSATAELKGGNNVIMRVIIRTKTMQESISSDIKEIEVQSVRDLSPGEYSLAIHSGKMPGTSCDDAAIGSLFDPAGYRNRAKYQCDQKNATETCAAGDLRGKFGTFSPMLSNLINITWTDPDLRFSTANNGGIVDRTMMLYSGSNGRIACGVIVANKASTQVPQPAEPAGNAAASEHSTTMSMLVLTVLASVTAAVLF